MMQITKDEIIDKDEVLKMARQAGFERVIQVNPHTGIETIETYAPDSLERFAKLVAAKERDACLEVIETHRIPVGNSAAGEMACEWTYEALKEIVAKIRVRGEA